MKEVLVSSMGSIVLDMVCSALDNKLDALKESRKTEALLQSVEEDYQSAAFVIENILQLSITHKRPVSERTIANAEKIDTLQGWRLLAHYYAEKNNAKLAMNAVKAILT